MFKTSTWATDLLKLLYQNVATAKIGDASGLQPSGTTGSLYLSLHTGDPSGGDQTTNETAYGAYVRKDVARDNSHWTVAAAVAQNALTVQWAQCTSGTSTITHVGIGTDASGTGKLLMSGPLIPTWVDATGKASTDILTAPGHALSVNDTVQVTSVIGGTLPGGLAVSTTYYVKTVSGNDITLSTSMGGATLDITADGACLIGKIVTLSVITGVIPQAAANSIVHSEA
jgi:hypothetical protein